MGLVQDGWGMWAEPSHGPTGAGFEKVGAGGSADPEPLLGVVADLGLNQTLCLAGMKTSNASEVRGS